MNRHQLCLLMSLAGTLLLPTVASPQSSSTGAIAGVARDTTGAVLPGVTIEAASPALIEKVRTVITDSEGQYKIVELRPGSYVVTFSLSGFSTVKREGIELTTGFTAAINAEMKVGSLEETITVSGASPVVDTQNVRTQNVLSNTTLDTLPTNKTIQGFATLTVGATTSGAGGATNDVGGNKTDQYSTVNFHGNTANDGRMLYDGMRFNMMVTTGGGASKHYFVNQADVQEVVLEVSGQGAEAETSGVHMNMVPKTGGNTFRSYFATTGANGALQGTNLSEELKARGLTASSTVKKIYDLGGGLGGPIKKDSLWFYTAHRAWGSQEYAAGNFYNLTPHTPFYTPDLSRQGYSNYYNRDHTGRVTWQATAKHKFAGSFSKQRNCNCHLFVDDGTRAPEGAVDYTYFGVSLTQASWTFPATNRLLFQAGGTFLRNMTSPRAQVEVLPTDITIQDLSKGFAYNGPPSGLGTAGTGTGVNYGQHNERFSMSYITGSHAFKVGVFTLHGVQNFEEIHINQNLWYQFRNGLPVSLTQWAGPNHVEDTIKLNLGLYAQDQWTLNRLTLNLGIRFDSFNGYVPEQTRPAGQFVQEFHFSRIDNVPNYKDISPRMGAAYDLFGNGKTAIKGSIGRYVAGVGASFTDSVNPANAMVLNSNRTWDDQKFGAGDPRSGNYVPDCNLNNFAANNECGALDNAAFGTLRVTRNFAPDSREGWGVREHNWQTDFSVQHELRPNMAVNVGYYNSRFSNFQVNDNLEVTPADFNAFCIKAPTDARLPGGGGFQVCDLADVSLAKFGKIDNLVTQSSRFGGQTRTYNGVDVVFSARFGRGGVFGGGTSTGRTSTYCAVVDAPVQFCDNQPPFLTQFKLNGAYPLPWWKLQGSATFQRLPGIPLLATYAPSNAEIVPSLGRNLASCGATVPCNAVFSTILPNTAVPTAINLIEPNRTFEKRLSQLDVRLTKIFQVRRARIMANFDVYNILNGGTILGVVTRYGPTWLRPVSVQGARLFKFGAQLDF